MDLPGLFSEKPPEHSEHVSNVKESDFQGKANVQVGRNPPHLT